MSLPSSSSSAEKRRISQGFVDGRQNASFVLMAIPEGMRSGSEVHEGHDQLLYFVAGPAWPRIGDVETEIRRMGDVSIVPFRGEFQTNFRNTGSEC